MTQEKLHTLTAVMEKALEDARAGQRLLAAVSGGADSVCLLLCAFLVYVTFKDFKANPGSPLFYAAMSILFLTSLGLAIRDTVMIIRLKKELQSVGD